jgi:transposase
MRVIVVGGRSASSEYDHWCFLKTIQTVCSDMYEGFTEAVREEIQNA